MARSTTVVPDTRGSDLCPLRLFASFTPIYLRYIDLMPRLRFFFFSRRLPPGFLFGYLIHFSLSPDLEPCS